MVEEPEEHEIDALSRLEERIQRAVALVLKLREEKEAAEKDLFESQAENAKLLEELEALRSERKQVRGRLEKLLDHIDRLSAA